MIRPANDRTIGAEEARLLTTVQPGALLARAAFAGRPFHIEDEKRPAGQDRTLFPEALVLGMIKSGLLYATQQTEPWVERRLPARPFTVRLTKDGEQERVRLLRGLTTRDAA